MKNLAFSTLFLLALNNAIFSQPITFTLNDSNCIDACVIESSPASNFGDATNIFFGGDGNARINLFVRFDLSSIAKSTTISAVRYDLYMFIQNSNINYEYSVYKVTEEWFEDSITWNHQPAYDTIPICTFSGASWNMKYPQYHSIIDFEGLVQQWVDSVIPNYGIVIKAVDNYNGAPYLYSSENGAFKPRLVLNSNNASFTGIISDSASSTPLPNFIISAYDSTGKTFIAGDTSETDGSYHLNVIYPGKYNIIVKGATGFMGKNIKGLVVSEGEALNQDIALVQNTHAVAGKIWGTWTKANSPYLIVSDVYVPADTLLTIDPGVEIKFTGHFSFLIKGKLVALGQSGDSIKFTRYLASDDCLHKGLKFTSNKDTSRLSFCIVEYGNADDATYNNASGGGINCYYSNIIIENCNIRNNTAKIGGGGIYAFLYKNTGGYLFILRNSIIQNNILANSNSGGMGGAGLSLLYSKPGYTFVVSNLIINNVMIHSNYGNAEGGGGVRLDGGTTTFANNTLYGNSSGKGSGILTIDDYEGTITNNIIWNNIGSVHNEQIAVQTGYDPSPIPANLTIQYNTIENNAIVVVSRNNLQDDKVKNTTGNLALDPLFADTTNHDFSLLAASYAINSADPDTSGLKLPLNDMLGNSRIFDNKIDMGALEFHGTKLNRLPLLNKMGDQRTRSNMTKHLKVSYRDFDAGDSHTITINSNEPNVTVQNLSGDTANSTFDLVPATSWLGTAKNSITVKDAVDTVCELNTDTFTLTVSDQICGNISDNETWSDTVLVSCDVIVDAGATLTISPGTLVQFEDSVALIINGKLIAIGNTGGDSITFTEKDTTGFYNNSYKGWRGIRFMENASDTSFINYCVFQYGKSTGSGNSGKGGAILIDKYANIEISNSTFNSNSSSISGGAIDGSYFGGKIVDNHFWYNKSVFGGAVNLYQSEVTFMNNWLVFNNASEGGALYGNNINNLIAFNTFAFDTSTDNGGGIYVDNCYSYFIGNTIKNNKALEFGGGISASHFYGKLFNNLIYKNEARYGGGVNLESFSNAEIKNNSICYNNATESGGGLYQNYASPVFRNTILWGNTAAVSGKQVFINNASWEPEFYYCNVQQGKSGFEGTGAGINYDFDYNNNHNIDALPGFVDSTSFDFHLKNTSLCIGAGDPDTDTTQMSYDFDLKPRVYNTIDIGAFEYWPVNVAPQNILLSKANINENSVPNSLVGVFSTVDPNASDQHNYSFASDGGIHDVDNSSFSIINDSLFMTIQPHYDIKNSYSIYVETKDNGIGTLTYKKAFVIKINKVIDNIINKNLACMLGIFPNPAKDLANLSFNSNTYETSLIEIIDLKGTIIWKDKITSVKGQNIVKLNLSNYSEGIYLVRLTNNEHTLNYKLVVRH